MIVSEGSPLWWLRRLNKAREDRASRLSMLQNYATGDHPLPEGSRKWRDYYRQWQKRSRSNYCGLASTSVAERMHVNGFRTEASVADDRVWSWWKANHMEADSDLVHHTSANLGVAYVMVGSNGDRPLITPESPFQTIIETSPLDRRQAVAGLKVWDDDAAKKVRAIVYLPDAYHHFEAPQPERWQAQKDIDWTPAGVPIPNPVGRVPIVEFVNRPGLVGPGLAEFEDAIDVQDRINSLVLHLLTIAQSQAFRQRYVKGLATEDEDGNPIDPPFEALVSALWVVEDSEVEFGEFQQVDLKPLLDALQASITQFVSLTGLPPHYVAGDLVNASADALAAAEARLVAKVRARQRVAGESWEQVLALGARWVGEDLPGEVEVRWADPERKTDSQLADAALKASQFGVPWEQRMIDYGYSPQEIKRMQAQKTQEAQDNASAAALTARATLGELDSGFAQ